jgi:hypothetical protein
MNRALLLALLGIIAASISACGGAFFAVSLLKAHPCPCADGYACVDEVCVPADALQLDQACTEDAQCDADLICRDKFGPTCNPFDLNANCTAGAQNQGPQGEQCRQVCNPAQPWLEQCRPGEACYPDVDGNTGAGYCQAGACAGDTECGLNALCMGRNINPDTAGENGSGQCFRGCDPFNCEGGDCSDCPPEDVDGDGLDDLLACTPIPEWGEFLNRTVCLPAGAVPAGGVCSTTDVCRPGSFCDFQDIATTGTGLCRQYCRTAGGQPACNAPEQCTGVVDQFSGIGFCR